MIDTASYTALISIAKGIVKGSQVHHLDVVHDAILTGKDSITRKDLANSFYSIKRINAELVEYKDVPPGRRPIKTRTKICKRCTDTLPMSAFTYKDGKGHYQNTCDRCIRKRAIDYYYENKSSFNQARKKYYETNKDKELQRIKAWYIDNRSARIAYVTKWREENPDKVAQYNANRKKQVNTSKRKAATKAWKENNRDRVRAYRRKYYEDNKK